jgi:hypothetical protein
MNLSPNQEVIRFVRRIGDKLFEEVEAVDPSEKDLFMLIEEKTSTPDKERGHYYISDGKDKWPAYEPYKVVITKEERRGIWAIAK